MDGLSGTSVTLTLTLNITEPPGHAMGNPRKTSNTVTNNNPNQTNHTRSQTLNNTQQYISSPHQHYIGTHHQQ